MRVPIRGAGLRLALSAAALATAVTTGGAIGALGGAVAPAASAATVHSAAVAKPIHKPIHRARCTRTTFSVFYGTHGKLREKCYEGVGKISPGIRNVQLIRTGINTGFFAARGCRAREVIQFRPGETFRFTPGCRVSLDVLRITRA
jgi:hypothetical protein